MVKRSAAEAFPAQNEESQRQTRCKVSTEPKMTLVDLPDDVFQVIIQSLDETSLLALRLTSRRLHHAAKVSTVRSFYVLADKKEDTLEANGTLVSQRVRNIFPCSQVFEIHQHKYATRESPMRFVDLPVYDFVTVNYIKNKSGATLLFSTKLPSINIDRVAFDAINDYTADLPMNNLISDSSLLSKREVYVRDNNPFISRCMVFYRTPSDFLFEVVRYHTSGLVTVFEPEVNSLRSIDPRSPENSYVGDMPDLDLSELGIPNVKW